MKATLIERWLFKQTFSEALLNVPVGFICLFASLVYLSVTLGVVFLAASMLFSLLATAARTAFDHNWDPSFWLSVGVSGIFLIWLFASHYLRNAEHLRMSRFRSAPVHVSDAGIARALNILLSTPREDAPAQRLIYTGPQWLVTAISLFYKSFTLLTMDLESCAKILRVVVNKGSRVSFTELAKLLPEVNAVKVFPQMRDIAGVVFLQTEPSGITLTMDLRIELGRLLGVRPRVDPQPHSRPRTPPRPPPPPPTVEEEPTGPHKVLGVPANASLAEIKAAYRKQIKQCHPDRFATLNQDWQRMAEQRAKALNAAYAILTNRASARKRR